MSEYYCSHKPPCCPQVDKLLQTIATERDSFGKRETELMVRVERLEKALSRIGLVALDPDMGQIVSSEHYEKAWLDCVGIAKAVLRDGEGK